MDTLLNELDAPLTLAASQLSLGQADAALRTLDRVKPFEFGTIAGPLPNYIRALTYLRLRRPLITIAGAVRNTAAFFEGLVATKGPATDLSPWKLWPEQDRSEMLELLLCSNAFARYQWIELIVNLEPSRGHSAEVVKIDQTNVRWLATFFDHGRSLGAGGFTQTGHPVVMDCIVFDMS